MDIVIINSVLVICFTVLSIYFDRWWIVLFSALFLFTRQITTNERDKENKNDREGMSE